ncbi:tetratricopeptide repeat protein, partial [Candidatus Calescamantes bacterium]|nr:tetratricopeptide repeat protein [Candidatus Calescamantes bacterium]
LIGALNSGKYSLFETFKAIEKLIKDGNIVLTETETATDELRKEFPEEVESLLSESEYFNEGYNYFKEGLYSQALNEFQKVLALFADNPIIYLYIAVCDIYLSKLKDAGEVLTKVLKISPEHPFVYLLLAKIFFRLKKDEKAVGYLKQGLKHNSGNVPLLWEMAGYFYKVRDLTNATGKYKEILKIQPGNVQTYLKLGAIYLKEGNTSQAVEAWKHALKHDPENKIAKTNLESIGEK